MIQSKERRAWAAAFVLVAVVAALPYILTPRPYWDVRLVETKQDGPWRYLTVNFVKGECTREDVVFLGHRLGLTDNLTSAWHGLDGAEADHDRISGVQTLYGRIYTGAIEYESFEIRTRHNCDGKRVDRSFITIPAN